MLPEQEREAKINNTTLKKNKRYIFKPSPVYDQQEVFEECLEMFPKDKKWRKVKQSYKEIFSLTDGMPLLND